MLNRIIVMGRLTKDPELRDAKGTPVCTIRIACDRDFKSQNGERETDFFDVVAWRGLADTVSKYFTKGRMIVVDGRLQIRPWTDRDNVKRNATEIVADHVYFGDSKPQDGQSGPVSAGNYNGNAGGSGQNNGYGGYGSAPAYGGAPGYGGSASFSGPPDDFVPNFGGGFPS